MDTREFFDLIWPNVGLRCIAVSNPNGRGLRQKFVSTNEAAANYVAQLDGAGFTVYHSCATFSAPSRSQSVVEAVKCFWSDIDCGPGKPYASQKDAAKALVLFAQNIKWPMPYIIQSGNGIHAYWPFAQPVSGPTWKAAAERLKSVMQERGLGFDPSRQADHASILRPVGSTHRKGAPKPVKLIYRGSVSEFDDLVARLPKQPDALEGSPASAFSSASNDDLAAGLEHAPSYADQVADGCGVVGRMRSTQGQVSEPTWYAVLGILAKCEDGESKIQEWSMGHPSYSATETKRKFAHASKHGPATCDHIKQHEPLTCSRCPFAGKVKSPIVLGVADRGAAAVTTVKKAAPQSLVQAFSSMPYGYRIAVDPRMGKKTMQAHVDPTTQRNVAESPTSFPHVIDGKWETFCGQIFYPISRMTVDGQAHTEFEMLLKGGDTRRFTMKGAVIGKGKDGIASALGENEIVAVGTNALNKMDSLLKRWMDQLTDTATLIQGHQAFGWTDDKTFVVGEDVITPSGRNGRAVLGGAARSKLEALEPRGTLATWTDVVNRAYNAPGQEGYQFLVALGFAAPLLKMLKQINGATVYAHSDESGVGKTTATRVALSAWGNWDELQLSEGKATQGSLWALMGCYNSLPIVFDELTNMDSRVASELVFSVSSGRARQRLHASGDLRTNAQNWNTIMLASGNNMLSEKLANHRSNPEAEISRLFEFTLTATSHLTPNEANQLFPKLLDNYGHAGRAFIQFVVTNYDKVQAMLESTQNSINTVASIDQKERYWSAILACALVATAICRKLSLLQFDLQGLRTWMLAQLETNRRERDVLVGMPSENIGRMLADLWSGVLITAGRGDMRTGQMATVVEKPHGQMVGRAIIPGGRGSTTVPALYISCAAFRDWATRKGISARELHANGVRDGLIDTAQVKMSLGQGTVEYGVVSSVQRCYKLNPDKLANYGGMGSMASKLTAIAGGKDQPAASSS